MRAKLLGYPLRLGRVGGFRRLSSSSCLEVEGSNKNEAPTWCYYFRTRFQCHYVIQNEGLRIMIHSSESTRACLQNNIKKHTYLGRYIFNPPALTSPSLSPRARHYIPLSDLPPRFLLFACCRNYSVLLLTPSAHTAIGPPARLEGSQALSPCAVWPPCPGRRRGEKGEGEGAGAL